jgi:hypothetical protein
MAAIEPGQAALYSLSSNKSDGRIYNHRVEFGIEKKLRVKASYQHCKRPTKAFD